MEMMLVFIFLFLIAGLLSGYPVAFVLSGVSLIFALIGVNMGIFDVEYISAIPERIYGIMQNDLLIAVPLFVFMGVMLQRANIAEELLENMSYVFGRLNAGLGISVMFVGALLAASTGIVGATVVTMGLISLPTMLKAGYCPKISTGTICAAGTLGQIIPPSIVLILLGDQISNAHQTAQMKMGNLSASPVTIADLFVGAIIPGFMIVFLYVAWLLIYSFIYPERVPPSISKKKISKVKIFKSLLPPMLLILVVLGSILSGVATATESAAVGAVGALLLATIYKRLSIDNLKEVLRSTTKVCAMVFTILIGAAMFTLVFRGYGGDEIVHKMLVSLPGGMVTVMICTMVLMFLLGFFLDFIEIIYVVVPIVAPALLTMGADPIWLAIMIAINLQTSFLTPPFGFSLFYLRGVAPRKILSSDIYKGVIPFVSIQILALVILSCTPSLATWLPEKIYGTREIPKGVNSFEFEQPDTGYTVDF